MSRRLKTVIWIGALLLLFIAVLMLTPYLTYLRLGLYVVQHPDQTVFVGDNYSQTSAVNHSDESNWDGIASQHPALYWGVKPNNCTFQGKDDTIFSFTGIWIAQWSCHP